MRCPQLDLIPPLLIEWSYRYAANNLPWSWSFHFRNRYNHVLMLGFHPFSNLFHKQDDRQKITGCSAWPNLRSESLLLESNNGARAQHKHRQKQRGDFGYDKQRLVSATEHADVSLVCGSKENSDWCDEFLNPWHRRWPIGALEEDRSSVLVEWELVGVSQNLFFLKASAQHARASRNEALSEAIILSEDLSNR